jgi:hypothetical protein
MAVTGASMRTAGRKRPAGINANRPSNRDVYGVVALLKAFKVV